jgi:signal transduction histidine kinase
VKHTGRGGTITLRATKTEDSVQMDVEDNGHGIPSNFLETIFEKFGQVETRQRTGTGLGLTFCKMAVEAHGGQIWVTSVEGEGSKFSFSMPLSPRE